ncbi:hypothetical protein HDU86_005071 [Geranomyces michiganensis]|nr:hypothetical protein HDU86_005071 [Geranomyces michiganensis]
MAAPDMAKVNHNHHNHNYDSEMSKETLAYPSAHTLDGGAIDASSPATIRDADGNELYNDRKLEHGLKRELKSRHISMISIGGTIGTGLFVASGSTIATAGPLGALIAYAFMGFVVFCIMTALGEMATLIPVTGSFNHYASRFVDPALGFALGWNYWLSWAVTIATELAAAGVIINYWKEVMPTYIWSLIILAIIVVFNLFGGRGYGESEYWLSFVKIITVILFIIVGICVAAGVGGTTHGFKNWSDPGAIVTDGDYSRAGVNALFAVCATMVNVGFSYMGTEIVGVTAGETANPRKSVPRAIRNVFWRILLFFMGSIFVMGLVIRSDDPKLTEQSPFTTVFSAINIGGVDSIINAVLLTVIISASNSALYTGSRTLMALAREGKAPRIFSRVNGRGVPIPAIIVTSSFGIIVAAGSVYASTDVMNWVLAVSSISGFISWAGIGFTHYRFRKAYIAQGRDVSKLPYRAWGFPFSSLFGGAVTGIIALTYGATAIWPEWNISLFFQDTIPLFIFVITYVGYKVVMKSKMVPLLAADFDTGVRWAEIGHEQDTYVRKPRTVGSTFAGFFRQFIG